MRRLFWVAFGATVGVLVVRRLSRTAQSLTPAGLAGSLSESFAGLGDAIREFAVEVREGMAEREAELRDGVGIDGRLGAMPSDFTVPRPGDPSQT